MNTTHSSTSSPGRSAWCITRTTVLGLLMGLSLTPGSAEIVVHHSTMSAGGGVSSSDRYRVHATVGQTAASSSRAGAYELTAGYWHGAVAIQVPRAPRLSIRHDQTGAGLLVTWPIDAGNWVLQETTSLDAATPWTDVRTAARESEKEFQVAVSKAAGIRFYRLREQGPADL